MLAGECTYSVFSLSSLSVCLCASFRVGVGFFPFKVGVCLGVGWHFVEGHRNKEGQLHNKVENCLLTHPCDSFSIFFLFSGTRSILQQLFVSLMFPNLLEAGEYQKLQPISFILRVSITVLITYLPTLSCNFCISSGFSR